MHQKIVHSIAHLVYVILYALLVMSCFLFYDSLKLVELSYFGWVILIFGVLLLLISNLSRKGRSSKGNREILVEDGLYALVRHPEFLAHMLISSSLILMSQHLVSALVGMALIVLLSLAMVEEEKRNVEKFGDAYRDYMRRVPRINVLAGIVKRMRERRG